MKGKNKKNGTFVGLSVKNSAIQNHDISLVHEEKKKLFELDICMINFAKNSVIS